MKNNFIIRLVASLVAWLQDKQKSKEIKIVLYRPVRWLLTKGVRISGILRKAGDRILRKSRCWGQN